MYGKYGILHIPYINSVIKLICVPTPKIQHNLTTNQQYHYIAFLHIDARGLNMYSKA